MGDRTAIAPNAIDTSAQARHSHRNGPVPGGALDTWNPSRSKANTLMLNNQSAAQFISVDVVLASTRINTRTMCERT